MCVKFPMQVRSQSVLPLTAMLLVTMMASTASAQYTFTDIVFPGASETTAEAINDAGTVVGHYRSPSDGQLHGFVLDEGLYTTLDYPGAPGTLLLGINSHGDIVGYYCFSSCSYYDRYPFVYDGSVFTALPQPAAAAPANTVPQDIDDAGRISGNYLDPCFCKFHGFIYSGGASGTYTTIDRPAYASTSVTGINNAGATVGTVGTDLLSTPGGIDQGFIRDATGSYIDIPVSKHSYPADINNSNQVVGQAGDGTNPYVSYLIDGSVATSFDPPGTSGGSGARGINASGTVVGWYIGSDGSVRGYSAAIEPVYEICLQYDSTRSVKSGATIPIKLQLCDATGQNLSSAAIALHATGVVQVSSSASSDVQDPGNSNPDNNFRFDNGTYILNLKTTGLGGSYVLNFTIDGAAQIYSAPFQVK